MPQFNENFSGMIRIPLFNNTKSFNGTFVNKIEKELSYKGTILIQPTSRVSSTIVIDGQNNLKYNGNVTIIALTDSKPYPGLINIPLFEQTSKQVSVVYILLEYQSLKNV